MKQKLQRFMIGRYGSDGLNQFLCILSFVLYIVAIFSGWIIFSVFAMALLIVCIIRMFSRNIGQRLKEYQFFYRIKNRFFQFFGNAKVRFRQRKTHKFYKCPSCHQSLRVPKGLGELSITCPKCKTQFTKKS